MRPLWPAAITGMPGPVTPRTSRPGAWTSYSTNSSGIEKPSCGAENSEAVLPGPRRAKWKEPPRAGRRPATCARAAAALGGRSFFRNFCDALKPRRSSARLRPGWDGKRPAEAGTVVGVPAWRRGR